jgi:L-lactate dehydrogenase complex protein LldG
MSAAREDILGGIRRALGRGSLPAETAAALDRRLVEHRRNLVPARAASLDPAARIDLFVAMAEEVQTTVTRVAADAEVPAEVARYLAAENLPAELAMAPDPARATLAADAPRPRRARRRGQPDAVSRRNCRDRHADAGLR